MVAAPWVKPPPAMATPLVNPDAKYGSIALPSVTAPWTILKNTALGPLNARSLEKMLVTWLERKDEVGVYCLPQRCRPAVRVPELGTCSQRRSVLRRNSSKRRGRI